MRPSLFDPWAFISPKRRALLDATYDGHKGQGYQVQVMETGTTTEDKAQKEQTLNLITFVAVEPAHVSDTHALVPPIEDTRVRGMAAVRYTAVLKAAGLNLMRAVRVQRARIKARLRAAAAGPQRLRLRFWAFKERFADLIPKWIEFAPPYQAQADDGLAWAV